MLRLRLKIIAKLFHFFNGICNKLYNQYNNLYQEYLFKVGIKDTNLNKKIRTFKKVE